MRHYKKISCMGCKTSFFTPVYHKGSNYKDMGGFDPTRERKESEPCPKCGMKSIINIE